VRLVLYTGKGGVGKTTTAAAAAACAAERGCRTLVASADAAHSLGDVLERRLGPEPLRVAPGLDALEIDARVEAGRHWGRIQQWLVSLLLYQGIEAVVAEELASLPGVEELAALLSVERFAESGEYELIVLDCAPTGSALRLLTLPDLGRGMVRVALPVLRAVTGAAVPIARRLLSVPLPGSDVFREVEELLYRKLAALQHRITCAETSVRLVVTPERMVIDEARRAFTELSLFEVAVDALVMNRLLPEAAAREPFFRDWSALQGRRRREVEALFAPLPVLLAPLREDEVTGLERLAAHGRELFAQAGPGALLCEAPRVRYAREGVDYVARIPLPHACAEGLDVAKVGDELVVTTPSRRRALALPRRIACLRLAEAKLDGGTLCVRFARADAEVA